MKRALSIAIWGMGALLVGGCNSGGLVSGVAPAPAAVTQPAAPSLPTGAALGAIVGRYLLRW